MIDFLSVFKMVFKGSHGIFMDFYLSDSNIHITFAFRAAKAKIKLSNETIGPTHARQATFFLLFLQNLPVKI